MPIVIKNINSSNIAGQLIRQYNLQHLDIAPQPTNDYQIDRAISVDKALYTSSIGTPVLADLTFEAGSYTDSNGNNATFDAFTLETVLITLNQTKNIVKTAVNNRPGTIKQYISLGDYVVTINAIITGSNGVFPKDELVALKNILISPVSIKVTSWYLQLFDIDYILIDSYDVGQDEGAYSQQSLTINASSDNEIKINVLPQSVVNALNLGLIVF